MSKKCHPAKRISPLDGAQLDQDKNSQQTSSEKNSKLLPIKKSSSCVHSKDFKQRQEEHLIRKGLINAVRSSRVTAKMEMDELDDKDAVDSRSIGGRSSFSATPSLHPSIRSSYSMACSEITIGAGDNTGYWDFQHRTVTAKDLGHTCRECKGKFSRVGDPLTERRGARTSMRYHAGCFSGFADPRSQASSSMHVGTLAGSQMEAAPTEKADSKMRTGSHFTGTSSKSHFTGDYGNTPNKISAFLGGSPGFGSRSSKGKVADEPQGAAVTGGLSAEQLEEHNKIHALQKVQELSSETK